MNNEFDRELSNLLNRYNIDSYCGLPDYMLAEFIKHILQDLSYFKLKRSYDYVETFCGLEPFTTGKHDPFYQSGACTRHDESFEKRDKPISAVTARFIYDVANTAVINTAKAVYSVAAAPIYIAIGGLGGILRWVTKPKGEK